MKWSIVIPVYNEASVLDGTISEVGAYFSSIQEPFEIIVINDGSTDRTKSVLDQLQSRTPQLHMVSYSVNRGKGHAIAQGVAQARGEWVLIMDADLSTPVNMLERFTQYQSTHDIIIGSRAMGGSRVLVHQQLYKEWLGKAGNFCIRLLLGLPLHDTQCGFKLFRRTLAITLFSVIRLPRWGFDFEVLFLAHHEGVPIKEVPVDWADDGHSAVRWYEYAGTFADVFRVRWWYLMGNYKIQNPHNK